MMPYINNHTHIYNIVSNNSKSILPESGIYIHTYTICRVYIIADVVSRINFPRPLTKLRETGMQALSAVSLMSLEHN